MIAIIDYGSGNIKAIGNILNRLAVPFFIASKPEELPKATHIILPGVGAFDQAMNALNNSGMRQELDEQVLNQKKPVIGICVGMQLLANSSEEGVLPGLGWINGVVKKFDHERFQQRTHLPHMGWNIIKPVKETGIFNDVDLETGYYFLHSFYFSCESAQDQLAISDYGGEFACAVNKDNVYGVQFHPEKSHQAGIKLLHNFAKI